MAGAGGIVIGSLVDPGGVPRAKVVPRARLDAFVGVGMGLSPSWNVFCVDDDLAFTERFSVVGDLRLRIDADELRDLGDGVAWAPGTVHTLDGAVADSCTRDALRRTVDRLAARGLTALVGHEVEVTLFDADERPLRPWSAYGLGSALRDAAFLQRVLERSDAAGLAVLQLHAEYGPGQFEVSLAPRDPLAAADDLTLARTIVSLAARDVGLAASFSPLPQVEGASNGAHQHLSLQHDGEPVFSGGSAAHGLTAAGDAAVAGLVAALPELGAVLSGSPLSAARLRPGMWAGARACWGLENREAAVRLVAATAGTPTGANVEVKPVDASANAYLATAVLLEAALTGIETGLRAPDPVDVDPSAVVASAVLLPTDAAEQQQRLAASVAARRALGPALLEAVTAVRRRERETWASRPVEEAVERLRYAWTC